MTITLLQTIWFILILVLLTAYLAFDGFDLGAGFWHLFFKRDEERPQVLEAIGPFWDGNEVWLLAGGGALFAAFPAAYATVFSGFYFALIIVLFALILRAVSIDFRNKLESTTWRSTFDWLIFFGSTLPALLVGVAMGNVVFGIPIDVRGEFAGDFFTLLRPLPLLAGVTGLAFCLTHGAIYLALKFSDNLAPKAIRFARTSWFVYLVSFIALMASTFFIQPEIFANFRLMKPLWIFPCGALLAILMIAIGLLKGSPRFAFISSVASIVCVMTSLGIAAFPVLVRASNETTFHLTAFNSSSSLLTLKTMLIITAIGLPFVVGYNIWLYRAFRR